MKILVLNCGSSSVRFQVIATSPEQIAADADTLLAKGHIEKIGSAAATASGSAAGGAEARFGGAIPDHAAAIDAAFTWLRESGVVPDLREIEGVGHRVVHGGERFSASVRIDAEVVRAIAHCAELAPLHNPHNLEGYAASRRLLSHAVHVAVFDTAFHHTLPPRAYLYGLPYEQYARDRVRRYGFHGTSHRYVSERFARIQAKPPEECKLITCHLGNGCSVCAIAQGKSVDTSMGFTPLEGLLMGTRAGDVDAGAVLHLMARGGRDVHAMEELLNERSGLLGVSGVSNDMRDLLRERAAGNERARLAVELFCYRVRKYLGAYLAVLDGAEAVLFTGGIGENAPAIRAEICAALGSLGIALDAERNAAAVGSEREISADGAATKVWVIPTDEERLIARDTLRCILTDAT